MKRITIGVLFLIIMLSLTTFVFATEPQISLEGEGKIALGETKQLKVKINSNDIEVGVVSGKIEKENVTNMSVTGLNNWNLTYNNNTGEFNIYKAEGSKTEEIIKIEYTVPNEEGTAKITFSNVKLTTIDYVETEVANISKEISIVADSIQEEPEQPDEQAVLTDLKITKAPTKTEYKVGEKFDKTGMVVTAEYSDGTTKEITNYTYSPDGKLAQLNTKITVTYKEGDVTKTAEQSIKVISSASNPEKDEKPDGDLPKTGISNYYTVIAIVVTIGLVSYISYKKYKNV